MAASPWAGGHHIHAPRDQGEEPRRAFPAAFLSGRESCRLKGNKGNRPASNQNSGDKKA